MPNLTARPYRGVAQQEQCSGPTGAAQVIGSIAVMTRPALWIGVVLLAGCIRSETHTCNDGRTCPANLACDDRHATCVLPEQLTACSAQAELAGCAYPGVDLGTCVEGVCIPAGCGNAAVEAAEICDDGNQIDGDGCSATCMSSEVCGNGITDRAADEECDDANFANHDACTHACRREQPIWRDVSPSTPEGRLFHSMAYDLARGYVLVFGGFSTPQPPNLVLIPDTWKWNHESWQRITPAAGSPSQRVGHTLVFDTARGEVVMFGGTDGTARNDLWAWNGTAWQQLSPATSAVPSPRVEAAVSYDSARKRLVVFGGRDEGATLFGDTWEWDGTAWQQRATAGPPIRRAAAMAYDARRGKTVMFGGFATFALGAPGLRDTWEWDGTSWAQITGPAPSQRGYSAMSYDALRGTMVLFGGESSYIPKDDTWEWNGSTWQEKIQTPRPPVRSHHALAYEPIRNRVVLYGGTNSGVARADRWDWDGTTWRPIQVASMSPSARQGAAATYDSLRGRVVLFGGTDSTGPRADTWEWDGGAWRLITPSGSPPPPRTRAHLAYDMRRARVVLFGGTGTGGVLGDTWEWDGTTWLDRAPSNPPPARMDHRMAYDAVRGRIVLVSGVATANPFVLRDDLWEWDGTNWQQVILATRPAARHQHGVAYDPKRTRLVAFGGGSTLVGIQADTWTWDGTTWQDVSPTNDVGPPRQAIELVYDARLGETILFGGYDGKVNNDTWRWDGAGWHEVVPESTRPTQRFTYAMAYDGARGASVVFGGLDGSGARRSDTWILRHERVGTEEVCTTGFDVDDDGRVGCADPDCWAHCTPACVPGASCNPSAPRCGDGSCNQNLETCRLCAGDCGTCTVQCGDGFCDPGETTASCPGDCS